MSTLYDVLRRPLVTEKSSYQSGKLNQYSFIVADSATRTQVKDAIETLYDVRVVVVIRTDVSQCAIGVVAIVVSSVLWTLDVISATSLQKLPRLNMIRIA